MIIEEKITEGETIVPVMEDMSANTIVIQRGNIVVEAGVVVWVLTTIEVVEKLSMIAIETDIKVVQMKGMIWFIAWIFQECWLVYDLFIYCE